MFDKLNNKLEKIPAGFINFLTIFSSAVTIITPLIGFFTIRKMNLEEKNLFIAIYIVTLIITGSMLFNMYRYMIKYRKILVGVKFIISEKFFLYEQTVSE